MYIFVNLCINKNFFNTAPPTPPIFLGYTPGGATVPSAPLLPAVMHKDRQQVPLKCQQQARELLGIIGTIIYIYIYI